MDNATGFPDTKLSGCLGWIASIAIEKVGLDH